MGPDQGPGLPKRSPAFPPRETKTQKAAQRVVGKELGTLDESVTPSPGLYDDFSNPLEQSRGAAETSNQQESRVGTMRELKTLWKPGAHHTSPAQNAESPAPTPSSLSLPCWGSRRGQGDREVTTGGETLEGAGTKEEDRCCAESCKARPTLHLGARCPAP